ncbi:hypothetical protein EVAR_20292_1 [Eumeta japonica]|uniref:Endonuclease/exonuclease/phosphatase domain-containing protein n=1 Tax=Eumeta variegata TaxID=151549 RepID=A0A4C1VNP3_EUMVA|nr:hypothetical protein EVAR_20292_1 [Eumeta japonica]
MDNQPLLNIIWVYAPQTRCAGSAKEAFWDDFDEALNSFSSEKYIGGDLNGHENMECSDISAEDMCSIFGNKCKTEADMELGISKSEISNNNDPT